VTDADHLADVDPSDGRNETADQRSDRNWNDILQELRVTQTGTQIISAFLLTVAFQQRFPSLEPHDLVIYGILVSFAAASTVIGLTIVSLHRGQFGRHDKPQVVRIASRLLSIGVWIVAILTAGVLLFIFDFVFGMTAGIIAGVASLVVLVGLLIVLPRSVRLERGRAS
jgi:hypothetical protein